MNFFQRVFNISEDTDYKHTGENIEHNIQIIGPNVWMMVCSVLLACIGLDTNSVAIIIGAMLISPLMAPILGVGYSVSVHNRELFGRSIKNLVYVTFFSLLTAVIYFLITPLGQPTTEILARTKPTLLDIAVAFFGGVAGIISGSRIKQTIALPGVAIATALMPPICVAGFGLATRRWEIFGGAFYLFFINCVFIALATYLIVRLLKFPYKTYVEEGKQKRTARLAWLVLVIISAPSIFFLYSVYQKNRVNIVIQQQLINKFRNSGNEILKWEVDDQDSVKLIKAFFSGSPVSDADMLAYEERLKELGLSNYRISFFRMNISKTELDKLGTDVTQNILKNIELQNNRYKDSLQQTLNTIQEGGLYDEIKAFYPNLYKIGISNVQLKNNNSIDSVWTALLQWDEKTEEVNKKAAIQNIQKFLKKRLHTDTILINETTLLPPLKPEPNAIPPPAIIKNPK